MSDKVKGLTKHDGSTDRLNVIHVFKMADLIYILPVWQVYVKQQEIEFVSEQFLIESQTLSM